MKHLIQNVLVQIGEDYKDEITKGARHYQEVDIGRRAESLGYGEIGTRFRNINAVIPLRGPKQGMKVRIDGRTFVNYAQFDSGVVVPGFVARESGLAHKTYVPLDSMVLNFT